MTYLHVYQSKLRVQEVCVREATSIRAEPAAKLIPELKHHSSCSTAQTPQPPPRKHHSDSVHVSLVFDGADSLLQASLRRSSRLPVLAEHLNAGPREPLLRLEEARWSEGLQAAVGHRPTHPRAAHHQ